MELKNDEKINVDVFIFLLLNIYKRHLSPPVQKMLHFFVNIWSHENNLQDYGSQNPCRNGGRV